MLSVDHEPDIVWPTAQQPLLRVICNQNAIFFANKTVFLHSGSCATFNGSHFRNHCSSYCFCVVGLPNSYFIHSDHTCLHLQIVLDWQMIVLLETQCQIFNSMPMLWINRKVKFSVFFTADILDKIDKIHKGFCGYRHQKEQPCHVVNWHRTSTRHGQNHCQSAIMLFKQMVHTRINRFIVFQIKNSLWRKCWVIIFVEVPPEIRLIWTVRGIAIQNTCNLDVLEWRQTDASHTQEPTRIISFKWQAYTYVVRLSRHRSWDLHHKRI